MDIETVRRLAEISVRRGCAFAVLAIVTLMVGLSPMPAIAAKAGAILFAVMALVLHWKAERAHALDPRKTEVWLMLETRPALSVSAARVINESLRLTLLAHAKLSAMGAIALWVLSLVAAFAA